jgi:hypothetical protein
MLSINQLGLLGCGADESEGLLFMDALHDNRKRKKSR